MARTVVRAAKHSLLGRGSARRWTLSALTRIHPDPVLSSFRGVPLLFHLDNTTEKKALIRDSYDRDELDFLLKRLQGPPCTFIDIGANSGLYTAYLAAHMAAGSRVIAVEPNPEMCERIALNISLLRDSGLGKGVCIEIQASALGEERGYLHLDLQPGLGGARLTPDQGNHKVTVRVETLAQICRDRRVSQIRALKIDVEGYEDRVLLPFIAEAGRELLPRAIVMEHVHREDWARDVASACLAAGYRVEGNTRSSLLMSLGR